MMNESKAIITSAIDAAGFSWEVVENNPQPLLVNEKIVVEEIVTFTARKKTEIVKPV